MSKFESIAERRVPTAEELDLMRSDIDSYLYRVYRDIRAVEQWWNKDHAHLSALTGRGQVFRKKSPREIYKDPFGAVVVYSWVKTCLEV